MVLIATVNKESVTKINDDDYQIAVTFKVMDGEEVLLEKVYTERYYSALSVDAVKSKLQTKMIADWDQLVAEGVIYDHVDFGTMVTEIQTAANTYVNQ